MATAGKFSKGSSAKEEALKADTKAEKSDPTVPEPKKTEAKDPEPKKADTDTEAKTAEEDPGSGSGSPQDAVNEALEDVLQDPDEVESFQQEPTAYDFDGELVAVDEANDDTNNDVPEEDTGNEEFGGGTPEQNAVLAESFNSGESSDDDSVTVDGEIAEDDFVPVEEGAPAEEVVVEDLEEEGPNNGFGSGENGTGNSEQDESIDLSTQIDVIDDSFEDVAIEEDIVEEEEPDTEEDDSGMPSLAGATVSGFFDTSHLTDVDASLSDTIVDDDLFDA